MNYANIDGKKISSMTLGTVQLGMNYGIANNDGKPDEEKSFSMLRAAFENGITALDTARSYGDSEDIIGRFLKTWNGDIPYVATKIKKIPEGERDIEKHVINSIETSLEKLGLSKVDSVMLHSPDDLMAHGKTVVSALETVKKLGYTDNVGVSVYLANEIEEMLKYPSLNVTQIPMSIFDQRLIALGLPQKLKDTGYTVFVRSVFLQGLFFLDPSTISDPILIEHAVPSIRMLRDLASSEGMTVAQLAIAFMRDTAGVSSLVLGADTPKQVTENIAYFDTPSLSASTTEHIRKHFAKVDIPEIMKVLSRPKK